MPPHSLLMACGQGRAKERWVTPASLIAGTEGAWFQPAACRHPVQAMATARQLHLHNTCTKLASMSLSATSPTAPPPVLPLHFGGRCAAPHPPQTFAAVMSTWTH